MRKLLLIAVLVVSIALIILTIFFNVNEDDLTIEMMASGSHKIEGENAVELYVQYDWSKRRLIGTPETIEIEWNPEWVVYSYRLEVLEKGETIVSPYFVEKQGNRLKITIGNKFNFNVAQRGKISIFLIPNHKEKLKQMLNSAASIRYDHENLLFGRIVEGDSVSWKNEDFID